MEFDGGGQRIGAHLLLIRIVLVLVEEPLLVVPLERLDQGLGFLRLEAKAAQELSSKVQCRQEHLAFDDGHAEIHELMHMSPVAGTGVDGKIRKVLADHFGDAQRVLDIPDGQHERRRLLSARSA